MQPGTISLTRTNSAMRQRMHRGTTVTNHRRPSVVATDELTARLPDAIKAIGETLPTLSVLPNRMRFYDLQRRLSLRAVPLFAFTDEAIAAGAPLDVMLGLPKAWECAIRACYDRPRVGLVDALLLETTRQGEADPVQLSAVRKPEDRLLRQMIQRSLAHVNGLHLLIETADAELYASPRIHMM